MPDATDALRTSVDRLGALVRPLDDAALAGPAYPSAWTIADVMSHLGSGAVIAGQGVAASLAGTEVPDDFNQSVWDAWNAKSPRAKADDARAADEGLMATLEATAPEDRARFRRSLGPMELDWDGAIGMRLNEHLLHEWDVAVALDAAAPLAADGTDVVVDNLAMIAGFTAKAQGEARTLTVVTSDPQRSFIVIIGPEQVQLGSGGPNDAPDLTMPAESFIRLVYGRLDPDHTPVTVEGDAAALDQLRSVFPGF